MLRIHAEVQRTFRLPGESPGRIVDLHGGDAQVGEKKVEAAGIGRDLIHVFEIRADHGPAAFVVSQGPQAVLRLHGLDGVDVGGPEVSGVVQGLQEFQGVAAVAQGGVHAGLAG